MSETPDNPYEASAQDVSAPVEATVASSGSGMMGRLLIILVLFGIAAGGIYGAQWWSESGIPKGDPNFVKEQPDENTDMGDASGAMPQAPGA